MTQGIVEPNHTDINIEIQNRRLVSAGLLVPAIGLFGLIAYSIWKKNDLLFYVGMTLTILPILTIGVVGLIQESEMPYKNLILMVICIPLTLGLIKGVTEIIRFKKFKAVE